MRRRPRARLALWLAAAFAASACGQAPQSGVNVKALATDLVFGVPPLEEAVPPPNTSLTPEDPIGVISFTGPRLTPRPLPTDAAPRASCPKAGPNDFPDAPASTVVQGRVAAGTYRWNVAGTQNVTGVGTVPLPSVARRAIRDVRLTSAGFTFVQEEQELVFGSSTIVRTSFEVLNTGSPQRDAGVYLVRIERQSGGARSVFAPQPPVMYLPLPVTVGSPPGPGGVRAQEQMDNVGIDPSTQQALHHVGSVAGRKRVDVCGRLVDSFLVDATQEFIGAGGRVDRRNYDYAFAPHLGGLLIFEHVETPCTNQDDDGACQPPPSFKMDAGIAQTEPDGS